MIENLYIPWQVLNSKVLLSILFDRHIIYNIQRDINTVLVSVICHHMDTIQYNSYTLYVVEHI